MSYRGDYQAGGLVVVPFATNSSLGAAVAPSSPFEADDIRVYKNGSAVQRTSTSGITMNSPFDSVTGIHLLTIDLSDNADPGFYAAGNDYTVFLVPDTETVSSQAVAAVLCSFSIENRNTLSVNAAVSSVSSGAVASTNLTVYQYAAFSFVFTLTDDDGNALSQAGDTIKVVIWKQNTTLVELTGVVSGASNNIVTITGTGSTLTTPGEYRYVMRNTTDDTVLAIGNFTVIRAQDVA